MRIIVCINRPDDGDMDFSSDNKLNPDIPSILDTDNENALELALQIKDDRYDTEVIAITAGLPDSEDMLRECIAKGADDAILLTDSDFDKENPLMISTMLAEGIKKIGGAQMIIAGNQSFDLGAEQVTSQISKKLRLPLISQVSNLNIKDNTVNAKSELENTSLEVQADLPCMISVVKEINVPRYTTIPAMLQSLEKEIKIWDTDHLDIKNRKDMFDRHIQTLLSFSLKPRESGITLSGSTPEETAYDLLNHLRKRTVL